MADLGLSYDTALEDHQRCPQAKGETARWLFLHLCLLARPTRAKMEWNASLWVDDFAMRLSSVMLAPTHFKSDSHSIGAKGEKVVAD